MLKMKEGELRMETLANLSNIFDAIKALIDMIFEALDKVGAWNYYPPPSLFYNVQRRTLKFQTTPPRPLAALLSCSASSSR